MPNTELNIDPPIIPGQPRGLRFEIISSLAELGELSELAHTEEHDPRWAGGSMADALDMSAHGWDEPLPDVEALTDHMAPKQVFAPTLDVSGCEVDIDLYLLGEPECMIDYPMADRQVSSISVLVPVCYSAYVNESAVRKRGVAVAAALEELRLQGVAVTVYAYVMIGGRGSSNKYSTGNHSDSPISVSLIRLADTRLAYDLARITYAVGHPTMLRQLFFGYEDGWCQDDRRTWGIGNYGGRGSAPYSFDDIGQGFRHRQGQPTRQEVITEWVAGQLDTEVSVMLCALDGKHNKMSMMDHMEEVEGYFTQTKDLHDSDR